MNKTKSLLSILGILLGSALFLYGGYDDSPGGQLLGLAIAVIGTVGLIKCIKNKKKTLPPPQSPM